MFTSHLNSKPMRSQIFPLVAASLCYVTLIQVTGDRIWVTSCHVAWRHVTWCDITPRFQAFLCYTLLVTQIRAAVTGGEWLSVRNDTFHRKFYTNFIVKYRCDRGFIKEKHTPIISDLLEIDSSHFISLIVGRYVQYSNTDILGLPC